MQSHRSAPSRSPGFCTEGSWLSPHLSVGFRGRGRRVVAGREEAGDRNVPPSQRPPFPSVCVFELLGVLLQGQRSQDVFFHVYLQM